MIYEVGWVALYANIDLFVSEFGSRSTQGAWHRLTHPHWGWKSWLIGALIICVLFLVEGSYRNHRDLQEQTDKLRHDLESIPGPQLMIGYVGANYLAVQNNGGGTAYTIVLKVPEDGSIFISKPINILKENSERTIFILTAGQAMEAYMFVAHGAKTRPVAVECTDGDCRKFIYHFEQMTYPSGFLLKGKKCIGRGSMPHSPTEP